MISLKSAEFVLKELGARLRGARLAQNLSQQELGLRVGASLSSIRRLESTGQVNFHVVVSVAQALNAHGLDELFVMPKQSIADLEQGSQLAKRQRARRLTSKAAKP